jgi:E3 ubiquitin-protein ligase RNF14
MSTQYHGTKSRCVFSQAATIVDKYVNGDDRERSILEARYGKTNIKRMVDMYLEEQANAAWIKENSTPCPNCQLDIERSMGW